MNTWKEAVTEYYKFSHMGKNDFTFRKFFDPFFEGMDLKDIKKEHIAMVRSKIKGKPGTVNRYLNYFRAILMYAYEELGWLDAKPVIKKVKEDSLRVKYFSLDDIKKLHNELPLHLQKPFIFSLLTGVRMSNCFNLKWVDIMENQIAIDGSETKNGRSLCVPLNIKCRELLDSIEKVSPYVFTYAGRRITRASNTGWYTALKKANLEGCTSIKRLFK